MSSQTRSFLIYGDMSYIFSGISETLLVLAIIDIAIVSILSFIFIQTFKESLTSVSEKSEGPVHFYNLALKSFFLRDFRKINIITFFHFVTMHLAVFLLGLGLLLHSDWNFMGIILGIVWSYQITNRFIPGFQDLNEVE